MPLTAPAPRPTAAAPQHGPTVEPALLHEFFTRAARKWPEHVAVDAPPCAASEHRRTVTYAELDRLTDALALHLRAFVTGECVVAVLLPRNSEHVYLAQLAILKAGAAYVCIDPTFPDAQVGMILGDARPVAVLTDAAGVARVRHIDPARGALDVVAWTDAPHGHIAPLPPAPWLTPDSLAYLIYTSGTTGKPKGVMIEHGAIANMVRGDLVTFPAKPTDRVAQNSSVAYDSSVAEIWMALAAGATLVVMDDDATHLGPDLVPWLQTEGVTVFCPPPTLLRATGCANPGRELPELKRIHVGGEPLPQDVADRWAPGRCFVNDYGPTECSVVATRAVVRAGEAVTIGTPIPGFRAFVLNEHLEEVADGESGELCLGGPGLARGYLNDADMTARKFPVHPRLGRLYRTGDLVHRDAHGNFVCHGRIDAQVKVRGYRIELEAIESRLAACPGVRAAACRVQGEGPQQQIVAFLVPTDPAAPPHFDTLKGALRDQLPEYMVPAHFGLIDALPVAVSGKLDRRKLPALEVHAPEPHGRIIDPRDDIEERIATAVRALFGLKERVSVDHDFFHDLGGDSLRAAMLISKLRDDPATAALAVRDVYQARTIEGLAARVRAAQARGPAQAPSPPTARKNPFVATVFQLGWLFLGLMIAGPLSYWLAFHFVPDTTERLGLAPFLLATPLIYAGGICLYAVGSVAFVVAVKWLLIGRYAPTRAPIWGSFYVRNWIVQQTARLIPWRFFDGTVFTSTILRLLGAKVGRGVHFGRGVSLVHGGWDLLEIGDNVSVARDATLRLVDLEDGQIVVGPISIGDNCTLDIRSGLAPNTRLGANSYLAAQAYALPGTTVPAGARAAGIPAAPAGAAPEAPPLPPEGAREMSPAAHGVLLLGAKLALAALAVLPLALVALAVASVNEIDTATATAWLAHPTISANQFALSVLLVVLVVPGLLVSRCFSMRALGKIPEGTMSRWSYGYVRVLLKRDILDWANDWLNGTLMWRVWLRGAGMKLARDTELSTIFDTVPELTELGSGTFFADGIYLGAPLVHRGTVTLARTTLGNGVFLGNYAVVPIGQHIPDGVLLGVCTVADDRVIRPGTSWFGEPPFELPKREIVEADASLTHKPSTIRYVNRVFWELLRFTLPLVPLFLVIAWFAVLEAAQPEVSLPVLVFAVVPALDLGFLLGLCLFGLGLKWFLLGRVKPGTHALWSCWCSRWDFNYIAWHYLALAPMQALEGTVILNSYLRALGSKIGKNVVIGDVFAFVVDPDMLEVHDGATVSCLFQAHTFEDRVLKIDRVVIGASATVGVGAVLLYGCHIGDGARVAGHSVVMKRERLQPNHSYAGCPTHLVG